MDNKSLQDIALEYRNQGRSREEFEASVSNTLDTLRDPDGTPMVNRDQLMSQASSLASSIFDNLGLGEEAPEQEQVAQVPEMSEPPIEMVDDMFADPVAEDTTFFDNLPNIGMPMSAPRAGELGTVAGYVMGETPDDAADIAVNVQAELESFGFSQDFERVKSMFTDEAISDLDSALWENQEYLNLAVEDPEAGREIKKAAEQEKLAVKGTDATSRIIAETVADLTPEGRQQFLNFAPILEETLYARSIDSVFESAMDNEFENTNFLKMIATYLNPAQAVAGRVAQKKFIDLLNSKLGEDYDALLEGNYIFKAGHADLFNDFLLDREATIGELHERLDFMQELFDDLSDEHGINPVWTGELFDIARDGLRNQDTAVSLGAVIDTIDALDVTLIADALRLTGRMVGIKMFGRAGTNRAKRESMRQQTNDILRVMDEMAEETVSFRPDHVPFARTLPDDIETVQITGITGRGSMLDTMLTTDKANAERMIRTIREEGGIDGLNQLGLSDEQLLERMAPTGLSDSTRPAALKNHGTAVDDMNVSKARRDFLSEYGNYSLIDVLTDAERFSMADRFAALASRNSRGTLRTSASKVERFNDDGTATINVVFGTKDGGYRSLSEAEEAGRFLFGTPHTIKAKRSGRDEPLRPLNEIPEGQDLDFYVTVNADIKPDSQYVQAMSGEVHLQFPGAGYVQSPDRRIDREIQDTLNAMADSGTRMRSLLDRNIEPILKMRGSRKNKRTWEDALLWSDSNMTEFSTLSRMRQQFPDANQEVFEAYRATRDFYNSLGDIRQSNVYNSLNSRGFRSAEVDGRLLDDGDGPIYVRPIAGKRVQREVGDGIQEVTEGPTLRSQAPREGENVSMDDVWGDVIWDTRTQSEVPLTQQLIDQLYSGTEAVIARNSRYYNGPNGNQYSFSIVGMDKFQPLPLRPMNMRKGHLDLYYRGEPNLQDVLSGRTLRDGGRRSAGTGYKVEIEVPTIRDGQPTTYRRAVGIGATRADMERIKKNILTNPSDYARFGVGSADGTINPNSIHVVPTREGLVEVGMDQAGTPTGIPAHARQRSERLLGPDGIAETLDPVEAISRSMADARKMLGRDVLDVQKKRFTEKFRDLIEGGDTFPASKEAIVVRGGMDNPEQVKRSADSWFDIINTWESAVNGPATYKWTQSLRNWTEGLIEQGNPLQRALGKAIRPMTRTEFDNLAKQVSATYYIGARPLYQVMANSVISLNFAMNHPGYFTESIPRTLAMLSSLGNRRLANSKDLDAMFGWSWGRVTGQQFSGDEMRRLSDGMVESGLVSSSLGNDIFSVLNEATKVEVGRHNIRSANFWSRMVPGMGGIERAGKVGFMIGRLGTDYAKVQAYNLAASRILQEKGKDYLLSRRGIKEAASQAQRLTFNQNRMAPFTHQTNFLGIQFQFIQHVQRMFNDLIVDPALRVGTAGRFSLSKDHTNPYAATSAKAVWTVAGMVGLYGASAFTYSGHALPFESLHGQTPEEVAAWLDSKGINSDIVSTFLDGVVGSTVNDIVGARTNVQGRITPIGMLRTTFDLAFTNDGGLALGGPAAGLWDMWSGVWEMSRAVMTVEEFEPQEAFSMMLDAAGSMFAGIRDAEKAWLITQMGAHYTSGGRELFEAGGMEALAAAFGIPAERVEAYWRDQGAMADQRDRMGFIVDAMNKSITLELSRLPEEELNMRKLTEIVVGKFKYVDAYLGDSPLTYQAKETLLARAMSPGGFMDQYVDNLVGSLEPDAAIQRLKVLQQNLPEQDEVNQQLIDHYIESLERTIEANQRLRERN